MLGTNRATLLTSGSLAVLLLTSASPALAQIPAPAPAAAAPVGADTAPGISDIIVTAERRSESIQKSSLAIDVISGDELTRRGVFEARDLTTVNPAATISQTGAFTQTNIRGAGDFAANGLAQLAVSYSLDGVVLGQAPSIGSNFYDLARVEVLQGPQGTLYGRNATGGAVNLISNRPSLRGLEGYVTAEIGNYGNQRVTGAVNLPLGETVAVRGAFNVVDRGGYLSDGTDDDIRQAGRLQLLFEPTANFNLRLFGDYAHIGGKGSGVVLFPRQPGTGAWTAVSDPINNAAVQSDFPVPGFRANDFLPDSRIDLNQWGVGAELNFTIGDFATLTVIPAYRELEIRGVNYSFGFKGAYDPGRSKQRTVEARLGHDGDRFDWTVGGFYYDEDTFYSIPSTPLGDPVFATAFNIRSSINSRVKSAAVFGQATYGLTDRLRVIGGIRYTEDRVSYDGTVTDLAITPPPASPYPQNGRRTFSAVTWKGGVEYDIAPRSMAYFTASKGYKSGGFFYVGAIDSDNSFRPETLTALDVGIRNRFFDNTLQVNVEAFYWMYRDQQIPALGFTASGNIAYLTRNAGKADPRGASVDIVWNPTRADTLGLAVNYTYARYDEFEINYPGFLPPPPIGNSCSTALSGIILAIDCAGAPLPRTPEWSGTASYQHVVDLGNSGRLTPNVSATFASSRYLTADFFIPETKDGGYVQLNADLTYEAPAKNWSITLYGRNLTDKAVYNGAFASALNGFGRPGAAAYVLRTIGSPLTYGVRGTFRF